MNLPYNAWSKIEIFQQQLYGFYFLSMRVNGDEHPTRPKIINSMPRKFRNTYIHYVAQPNNLLHKKEIKQFEHNYKVMLVSFKVSFTSFENVFRIMKKNHRKMRSGMNLDEKLVFDQFMFFRVFSGN